MSCNPFKDRHTHTQTDRVTTEGTLSGFQDFFLQPIIKDRPNTGSRKVMKILNDNNATTNNVRVLRLSKECLALQVLTLLEKTVYVR